MILVAVLTLLWIYPVRVAEGASDKLHDFEVSVESRWAGRDAGSVIEKLGVPIRKFTQDGKEYLIWEDKVLVESDVVTRAVGCEATFRFDGGKLTDLRLIGAGTRGRRMCEKLCNPLFPAKK